MKSVIAFRKVDYNKCFKRVLSHGNEQKDILVKIPRVT